MPDNFTDRGGGGCMLIVDKKKYIRNVRPPTESNNSCKMVMEDLPFSIITVVNHN